MAQNGRKFRIKVDDGTGTFLTVAGAREDTMTIENGEIDITTKDSEARRELLEGGTQNFNCSTSGIYRGQDAGAQKLFDQAMSGAILPMQLIFADGEQFEGNFQVGNYERTGAHADATTFSCELKNSGAYTHTPPTAS